MSERRLSKGKRAAIWSFIVVWNLVFVYETFREFQLAPLARKACAALKVPFPAAGLPKLPMLFPPAGWIMFYQVGDSAGGMEIYGVDKGTTTLIDPHRVFATRYVLFDNIRRGMLFQAGDPGRQVPFCNYLRRKFPEFPDFAVTQFQYPSLTAERPLQRLRGVLYTCKPF